MRAVVALKMPRTQISTRAKITAQASFSETLGSSVEGVYQEESRELSRIQSCCV